MLCQPSPALVKPTLSSILRDPEPQTRFSAKVCIEAALRDDKELNGAPLRASARKLFGDVIEHADPKKTGLVQAARAAEIADKIARGEEPSPELLTPRTFGERLAWMERARLAYLAKRRSGQPQADALDAERVLDCEVEGIEKTPADGRGET